ncbi:MAG: SIMPL domain-containing protein [Dehalococcoidales bacterium]
MKKLKVIGALVLLIPLIIGFVGCDMYDNTESEVLSNIQSNQNIGIAVTATGEVKVTPDIALVNIGVSVRMKTLAEAQEQATQSMAAVVGALDKRKVAKEDIQTIRYNIQPVWDWVNGESVFAGYSIENMVKVKIRNMDAIGDIIDDAVSAGGEYAVVNGVSFAIENPDAYYDTARAAAMTKAKDKAAQLAKTAGVKVGKPISISESTNYYSIDRQDMGWLEADGSKGTAISAGELTVSVTVQAVYSII